MGVTIEGWGKISLEARRSLLDQLKLIWVSRIARAPEYRGYKIGTLLMQETLRALPVVLPFMVKHVEVIRTCGVEESESYDFLECAGFKKVKLRNQSSPSHQIDGDLFPKRKPYVKLYYWRKIENASRFENARFFVPLSQGPFLWFSNGEKTWELRRSRGPFTERHLYPGRPVELRLGYNTNRKLWGIVNRVITGNSIESMLDKIGDYKKVIPVASSFVDAVEKANSILKVHSDNYIAFEVTALFDPGNLI
jgi:hypothetical protein